MAIIGRFKAEKDGYSGTIRTLSINAKVRIVGNDRKGASGTPDFRVFAGESEIGAAWRKTAQEGGTAFLAVRIDDPSFSEPIRGALLEPADEVGVFRLVWRREKREAQRA